MPYDRVRDIEAYGGAAEDALARLEESYKNRSSNAFMVGFVVGLVIGLLIGVLL